MKMKFYLLICILVFTLEIVKIASLSLLVSSLGKVYIKAVLAIFERQLQVFFQDFLLGPFLQKRLSLAEPLGWLHPPPLPGGADTCTQ